MSKRDALLEAAKELLWERGYEATSPRQILKRSGAGQGSLYHHFEGKKDLAITALEQVEETMISAFERLFDERLPVTERIANALGKRRNALQGCPLGRMAGDPAIADESELREPAERYFRHVEQAISEALREAADSGEIRLREPAATIAAALVASVQGGYVLSRLHDDPRYLRMAVQCTLDMFRRFVSNTSVSSRARYALPVVSLGV